MKRIFNCLKSNFPTIAVIAMLTVAASAQTANDGFDPNVLETGYPPNTSVGAVLVLPDGKIMVSGYFTSVAGQTRNGIAKLNPDGSLDPAVFPAPLPNGLGSVLALQPDGKILIGSPTQNGGLARAGQDGTLDSGFAPSFAGDVAVAVPLPDGKILVGGNFTNVNGAPRKGLVRLNANGSTDHSFSPPALDGPGGYVAVYSIAVQNNGQIVVGGYFNSIGGLTRNNLLRLGADGTPDDYFDPAPDSIVYTVSVQMDGNLLAGGGFTAIGGHSRTGLARLLPGGRVDPAFNPSIVNPNPQLGNVMKAVELSNGEIMVGGFFWTVNGSPAMKVVCLRHNGASEPNFKDPGLMGYGVHYVNAIAEQSDGKLVIGGAMAYMIGTETRRGLARLNRDGTLDTTLDATVVGTQMRAIAVQDDGKILIGGNFTSILGTPRNNIARLNQNGTLDEAFNPNINGEVWAIRQSLDGRILVGGDFTQVGGQARMNFARLNRDGSFDPSFAADFDYPVYAIASQTDGKIVVGGDFEYVGTFERSGIARLNVDGSVDPGFNPSANNSVFSIIVQQNGGILAGGAFTVIGGRSRSRIARITQAGTVEDLDGFGTGYNGTVFTINELGDRTLIVGGAFTADIFSVPFPYLSRRDENGDLFGNDGRGTNGVVYATSVLANGKILIGGAFTDVAGTARTGLAIVDRYLYADTSFTANTSDLVTATTVQPDGKVLAGGIFATVGGLTRNRLARIATANPGGSTVTATGSGLQVTLAPYGAEPSLVTFERSFDGENFVPLGLGTRTGSLVWRLNGAFPIRGGYTYIRTRAFYRGGQGSASSSANVSVTAFFRPRSWFDFDGDGRTDLSIFRPSGGEWWYLQSSNGIDGAAQFAAQGMQLVPGDYTGDGRTDIAYWKPSDGNWYVLRSENGSYFSFPFGACGDIPAPADFDGDGLTDAAVFRPTNATWYVRNSSGGTMILEFGLADDKPVPADYDGDGKADLAIWRPGLGQWWWRNSSDSAIGAATFGAATDRPLPGDFTGDGRADIAFWRPSNGNWYVLRSENYTYYSFPFGISTDQPAPGDFDGDGVFDAAVFRASGGLWYLRQSTSGLEIASFGTNGDVAVPATLVR